MLLEMEFEAEFVKGLGLEFYNFAGHVGKVRMPGESVLATAGKRNVSLLKQAGALFANPRAGLEVIPDRRIVKRPHTDRAYLPRPFLRSDLPSKRFAPANVFGQAGQHS